MTKQLNILEEGEKLMRIAEQATGPKGYAFDIALRRLIAKVIEYVKPKRYTEDQGIDAEMAAFNSAIDEIEERQKELRL